LYLYIESCPHSLPCLPSASRWANSTSHCSASRSLLSRLPTSCCPHSRQHQRKCLHCKPERCQPSAATPQRAGCRPGYHPVHCPFFPRALPCMCPFMLLRFPTCCRPWSRPAPCTGWPPRPLPPATRCCCHRVANPCWVLVGHTRRCCLRAPRKNWRPCTVVFFFLGKGQGQGHAAWRRHGWLRALLAMRGFVGA